MEAGKIKMKNKKLIGLCGRSGSGKSYVCSVFTDFGGLHLDTDKIYHDLLLPVDGELSPCTKEIAENFGFGVISPEKTPDRRRLGEVVFSDGEKLELLNRITHKYILKKTLDTVNASDAPFGVVDAPVLFESGFDKYCDFTVCVTADDEVCTERIMKRDKIDREKALLRLSNQLSREKLRELCDYEIVNGKGADVTERVRYILTETGLYHEL